LLVSFSLREILQSKEYSDLQPCEAHTYWLGKKNVQKSLVKDVVCLVEKEHSLLDAIESWTKLKLMLDRTRMDAAAADDNPIRYPTVVDVMCQWLEWQLECCEQKLTDMETLYCDLMRSGSIFIVGE
jgi:hypothetical protein